MGIRWKSNEVIVSTPEGITTVKTVRRIPESKRWGEDTVKWVVWMPWHRYMGAEDADGEVQEGEGRGQRESGGG